jgi:hypothetical protein
MFGIQVSQTKFAVSKMIPNKIFGEVMEFFPKGLDPFKIQANLIFELFPGFLIQNPEGIGSLFAWILSITLPNLKSVGIN